MLRIDYTSCILYQILFNSLPDNTQMDELYMTACYVNCDAGILAQKDPAGVSAAAAVAAVLERDVEGEDGSSPPRR